MDGEPESVQTVPAEVSVQVRPRWRRTLEIAVIAASLVHPIATALGRYDWRIDLFTHFQWAALLTTVFAVALLLRHRPRMALALAVLAAFQVFPLVRYSGANPVKADPQSKARLRILMANVLCKNERYEELVEIIRRERPDVIGLVEYGHNWVQGLEEVKREYPHRLESPGEAKGVSLWFREAPASIEPPDVPLPRGWPFLHATFEFGGHLRHLWLIHPSSPFHRQELPELPALARRIKDVPGSQIVIGDMNSSDGSPLFWDFLAVTGLRDSRLGFGRQVSWPLWFFYRIPIDHAFVSGDLAVVDRRLGPDFGSDHAPLVLDLAPAAGAGGVRSSASPSKSK